MKIKHILKKILPSRVWRFLRLIQSRLLFLTAKLSTPAAPCQIKLLIEQYCLGNGIEIGPGKKPYCDPARTLFLDRYTDNKDATLNPDIVSDASKIPFEDGHFAFLVSSHCLEHGPNTLKTLYEWKRVIKHGGIMFLVLPHGNRTFDRYRAKTTLQHHIHDYEVLTEKPDYSHVDEIKEGWSKNPDFEQQRATYERQWGAQVWDFEFRIKNGVIHYHVWTQNEMIDILKYIGLQILYVMDMVPERNDSFLVIASK